MVRSVVMIMAGGKGSRLAPLTVHRAKPAVPFGGRYRIIDFVLSNFVNSGYRSIYVLTQYMASSLIKHLNRNWNISSIGEGVEVVPAQMRLGEFWYRGTADAVYQNLNLVRDAQLPHVAVFGGDHIYKFAIDQMEHEHVERESDLTVAAFAVPRDEASQFGVIQVDDQGTIKGFEEKPEVPTPIPGRPGECLVSMGNYLFRADVLQRELTCDAADPRSGHDFGKDIIPKLVREGARVRIYDFGENVVSGDPEGTPPYWEDVGTLEAYFRVNMDLRCRLPALNVYNRHWRIRTAQRDYPPARFVRSGEQGDPVEVIDSMVCEGSIVTSSRLREVLMGYDCFVQPGCVIEDSVFLSGCDIGAGAKLRRVLFDKNCKIAPGTVIGHDPARDRERFPWVTESGLVVLPKGTHVPPEGPIQLAYDQEDILRHDPATAETMAAFKDRYTLSGANRHSFFSAGPRHRLSSTPSRPLSSPGPVTAVAPPPLSPPMTQTRPTDEEQA